MPKIMYYVVEEYCVEAGCILREIKEKISDSDSVVYVSDNYQVCEEMVDAYHQHINEQIKEAEINTG